MAAVLRPQPSPRHPGAPTPSHRPTPRPRLVVLEGGRSAATLARRRTFLRRRVAVALVAALGTWGVVGALGAPSAAPSALPTHHVVQPGETLWGIAAALPLDVDVRVVVTELAEANGGAGVRAGQELVIPSSLVELGR